MIEENLVMVKHGCVSIRFMIRQKVAIIEKVSRVSSHAK
jgi:hypothetical protein